jgi:hypothetical protein
VDHDDDDDADEVDVKVLQIAQLSSDHTLPHIAKRCIVSLPAAACATLQDVLCTCRIVALEGGMLSCFDGPTT